MAFASGGLNRLSSREPAAGPRFVFFALLSLVLMYYDQKDGWSTQIRYGLQAAVYPIQVAVGSPRKLWRATSEFFTARNELEAQNAQLLARDQQLSIAAMRNAALEQENARLRGLNAALPPLVTRHVLADVVSADMGRLRHRLVVDQGDRVGVFRAQAAIDTGGLVGQTVRVGPFSAELMLITDPEHAVPVELVRNGLRTIAVGTGNTEELQLPFLPVNSDVKEGDLLVTSGLGGVFPSGIPVGTVIEFARDPDQILARARAKTAATLERDRQVMLLWFDANHPARPVDPKLLSELPPASVAQPAGAPQ
ncbi:MAG: rod shape-determining protein MreC [Nevskiaceae bacterium]|jgi:rod shape-determining protein MreC|nr:rod shape-determining protein MreC [Nevskiaceae bacterium]